MLASLYSATLNGIEAQLISIEIDLMGGLPGVTIVGLADTTVNESKERIRSAIKNCGFEFPGKRVVVNLAPADLRKEGACLDLPLALGVLLATEALAPTDWLHKTCFIGEVSLEGKLRPIQGVLPIALKMKALGFEYLVVPEANVKEASLVEGLTVFGLSSLLDLPIFLLHPHSFSKPIAYHTLFEQAQQQEVREEKAFLVDFADVKGQGKAKRALEIAAGGGHNVLMAGPPGSGKSMLAKAMAGILPTMSFEEALEVSQIYSAAGMLPQEKSLITQRPFRSPHHTASMAGITGGGSYPKPGEMTLAHRGILFLDELVEFPRSVIEVLRQPLEDGVLTISRAHQSSTFPARFMLVAAMNPCPCGVLGDNQQTCRCSDVQIQRYQGKLSNPLLDRIDIHIDVPRLSHTELMMNFEEESHAETSKEIQSRVTETRTRQHSRLKGEGIRTNAEMTPKQVRQHCKLDADGQELFHKAIKRLNISARAYDRILRVARTIADLAHSDRIYVSHLAEAIQYRPTLHQTRPITPALKAVSTVGVSKERRA